MTTQTLTISELTHDIKLLLEEGFSDIEVEGEISNFKQHSSGHRYFSLKDDGAQISCVMWRSRMLDFTPKDGDKVNITGRISVYPQRGNYQLDIFSMRQKGIGDLFIEFEKLKKKLKAKGYFELDVKQDLPVLPMNIGVATSPTGAAVQDIISTIGRRFPNAVIHFRPTLVQGIGAGEDIVKAIYELEKTPSEIIIIGRGGGSLEDLWCFNEEIVANAIFNCKVPIISAVGHETDFTISDFVADIRAATPTAAAELASPKTSDYLNEGLDSYESFMNNHFNNLINNYNEKIDLIIGIKTKNLIHNNINQKIQYLDDLEENIKKELAFNLKTYNQTINSFTSNIKNLNPKLPLEKGYAILKSKGKTINVKDSLKNYKNIEILRKNETAIANIKKLLPEQLF